MLFYTPPEWKKEHRYAHFSGMLFYTMPEWIREY
jgi:hypothetical protein